MAHDIAFSPAPGMELVDNIMREKFGGHDTWITEEYLDVDRCIPGIPTAYKQEQQENRAVYVKGLPHGWRNEPFETLIENFGTIEKAPCLISFASEHTFRWAIMATAEDADMLLNGMHWMNFHGLHLTTSMAAPAGRTLHLLSSRTAAQLPTPSSTPFQGFGAHTMHGQPYPAPNTDPREKTKETVSFTEYATPTTRARPVALPKEFTPSPRAPEFNPSSNAATTSAEPSRLSRDEIIIRIEPSSDTEEEEEEEAIPASPPAAPFVPLATSWANIASAANPSTNIVELRPSRRSASGRLRSVGRIPNVVRTERYSDNGESQADQMRVVFLLNLPNNLTLQDVSNGVQEGPVVQIVFGFDEEEHSRYAGVVFQYARDAEVFHQVLLKERAESRPERFRFIMEAVRGDPFPADAAIKAMSDPNINASRRLTMVKKAFFFAFGERHLTALCNKIAGEEHVQLVWLYNGGNATVVFSNVAAAMKMKTQVDAYVAGAGLPGGQPAIWQGLQTTYSKDPCQVPLVLTTAINN